MGTIISFSDAQMAKLREEQMVNGYTFPLNATFAGQFDPTEGAPRARIRRISTLDKAVIENLPKHVQAAVWSGLQEFQKQQRLAAQNNVAPQDMAEMFARNDQILGAATIWCKAAFIHPVLVDQPSDVQNDQQWWVERIAPEDRVSVFMMSLDSESEAMKRLEIFRPERAPDAPNHAIGASTAPTVGNLEIIQ